MDFGPPAAAQVKPFVGLGKSRAGPKKSGPYGAALTTFGGVRALASAPSHDRVGPMRPAARDRMRLRAGAVEVGVFGALAARLVARRVGCGLGTSFLWTCVDSLVRRSAAAVARGGVLAVLRHRPRRVPAQERPGMAAAAARCAEMRRPCRRSGAGWPFIRLAFGSFASWIIDNSLARTGMAREDKQNLGAMPQPVCRTGRPRFVGRVLPQLSGVAALAGAGRGPESPHARSLPRRWPGHRPAARSERVLLLVDFINPLDFPGSEQLARRPWRRRGPRRP